MCQFGDSKACPAEKINHIGRPVQSANSISGIVIAVMKSSSVCFEGTGKPRCGTPAVVNPSGEGFQILQFLGGVFHHQNARNATGRLCIEGVHVDAVTFRLGIYLIGDSIPAQRPFRFKQLSFVTQYIFHQEVSRIKSAHAISVMVDIAPATAVSHSLIGDMVIHRHKFPLHFLTGRRIRLTVMVSYRNPFHQIKISTHLDSHLGQHIFVPVRNHPLVGFGRTHHENGHSGNLPVLIGNPVEIIFLTDGFHFLLRNLPFGIDHITETPFQQTHFLPLAVAYGRQFDVRFQQGVFVKHQPVIGGAGIDKRHLQVRRLLAGIYLCRSDQMIDEKAPFCIGSHDTEPVHSLFRRPLHIAFIADPCRTPSFEIDAERKRGTLSAVFQKLKLDSSILRLFIVYPYDESGKIQVLPCRVFLFELQVFPEFQYAVRFKGPFQRIFSVFIMCTGSVQLRPHTCHTGRQLRLFKREHPLVRNYLRMEECRTEKRQYQQSH